jgi:PAS domain-containing protein
VELDSGACDPGRRVVAFTHLAVEVTAEVKAREQSEQTLRALRESEERYRLLFDNNPDAVFSVDPKGRFVMANRACEMVSGTRGRSFWKVLHGAVRAGLVGQDGRAF